MSENRQFDIVAEGIERFLNLLLNSHHWHADKNILALGTIIKFSKKYQVNIRGTVGTRGDAEKDISICLELKSIPNTSKLKITAFGIALIHKEENVASAIDIEAEDIALFYGKQYYVITCAADLYRYFQTYDQFAKLSGQPVIFNLP